MGRIVSKKVPNLTEANKATAANLRRLTEPGSDLYGLASGDTSAFEALERPVLRDFEEQTLPSIARQFSGAGLGDSSAFNNALAGANVRLQENLVANRESVRNRALGNLLSADSLLFANPDYTYQHIYKQGGGFFKRLLGLGKNILLGGVLGGGVGAIGGALTGGLSGAASGLLSGFGSGIGAAAPAALAGAGGGDIFGRASPFLLPSPSAGSANIIQPPDTIQANPTLSSLANVAGGTTPISGGANEAFSENDPKGVERRKAGSGRDRREPVTTGGS